jgi:Flp pilus assembly pilin Flp
MRKFFQNFRKSESGATLVEYGVALLVAIVVGGIALTNLAGSTTISMNTAGSVLPDSTDCGTLGC